MHKCNYETRERIYSSRIILESINKQLNVGVAWFLSKLFSVNYAISLCVCVCVCVNNAELFSLQVKRKQNAFSKGESLSPIYNKNKKSKKNPFTLFRFSPEDFKYCVYKYLNKVCGVVFQAFYCDSSFSLFKNKLHARCFSFFFCSLYC
jgi:hypothetical protein